MQITEAFGLTLWIKSDIEDVQTVPKFDNLLAPLEANARRGGNQAAQPFNQQQTDLLKTLGEINLNALTLSQMQTLDKMRLRENVGSRGEAKLEAIMRSTLDIANVRDQVVNMKNEIVNGLTTAKQLNSALAPFVEGSEPEVTSEQVLTRVTFERDASVQDIEDLREWTDKWFDIGRGFAIANGQTPKDVRVVGGARGSLILELALLATTAMPLAKAINLILDSMVKYRDFQKRGLEVKRLKDSSPAMAKDFDEDSQRWEARAQRLKEEVAEQTASTIVEYFSDYRKENKAELYKAVKTLVDFISRGGDVDCVIPRGGTGSSDNEKTTQRLESLREDFVKIRRMKEVLRIDHKRENSESNG